VTAHLGRVGSILPCADDVEHRETITSSNTISGFSSCDDDNDVKDDKGLIAIFVLTFPRPAFLPLGDE